MEPKKMVVILSVTICSLFGLIVGGSYAWYAYSNAESTISGRTKKDIPTVIFAKSDSILDSNIMPIKDEDRYSYATKNSFSITLGENLKDYKANIEIALDSIKMSDELKISNYKYELLENNVTISSGSFENVGNSNHLIIMPIKLYTPSKYPTTYNYDLYIWLSDDGSVQNNLMNKAFSARVLVDSALKK